MFIPPEGAPRAICSAGQTASEAQLLLRAYTLLTVIQEKKGENRVRRILRQLWKDERGQDLVEYGLLLVLVSLGAVAAMGTLASAISNAFGNASTNLSSS